MDNNQNSHSPPVFNNTRKIHTGIILDDWFCEAWISTMLEAIVGSDYASLDLVILNNTQGEKKPLGDTNFSDRNTFLYRAYSRLENRISQPNPAFTTTDVRDLLKNVPVLSIREKNSGSFQEQDIEKIRGSDLDVIIQCGSGMLKGDILTAAKYGVWSNTFSDTAIVRGGPPGFWETFERTGERGASLRIVTGDADDGIILYRSLLPCNYSFVSKNNNDCFLRSALFVPRTLKRLRDEGGSIFFDRITRENEGLHVYNNAVFSAPANFPFLKMFVKHAYRMGTNVIYPKFFRQQWFLLYDLQDRISTSFWRFKKMIPPKDRFWADPHVFFRDDIYYIFIEEYLYKTKKAHISLIEMEQSGTYSDPVKVLEEPFHLSYPHVFEHEGILYMIPETRKAKSINLYRCTDFPAGWKHQASLMDSVEAVDSTVLFHKNKWWLFTNIAEPEGTSPHNELYLFFSDNLLDKDWKSHPLNPVISDLKRARPAGKIIERKGKLYRPSQCCNPRYGYGIKLNEIVTLTEHDYSEREITFIEPKWDKRLKGVHTLCHENRLTMIDGYWNIFGIF